MRNAFELIENASPAKSDRAERRKHPSPGRDLSAREFIAPPGRFTSFLREFSVLSGFVTRCRTTMIGSRRPAINYGRRPTAREYFIGPLNISYGHVSARCVFGLGCFGKEMRLFVGICMFLRCDCVL